MKTKIAITLMLVAMSVGAEVYKCDKGGKSIYQSKPCNLNAPDSNKLKVKHQTVEEEATAKAKLKLIEAQNVAHKEKDEKAAREAIENRATLGTKAGVGLQNQQGVQSGKESNNPAMGGIPAYAPGR